MDIYIYTTVWNIDFMPMIQCRMNIYHYGGIVSDTARPFTLSHAAYTHTHIYINFENIYKYCVYADTFSISHIYMYIYIRICWSLDNIRLL